MDSQKNRAEIDRLLAQIEMNLHQGAVMALYEDMRSLKQCTIYSDCEAYRKWNAIKSEVIQCLFHGLPFPQILEIPTGFNLHKFDIVHALDGVAEEMTLEQLFSLSEHFESLPGERGSPHLFQRLVDTSDEAVTLWLRHWIENRLPAEQANGAALSSHLKLISTFTIRWMPDDKDLSGAVKILCLRDDPLARQLTSEYLFSLPWGQDRQATNALLSGLAEAKTSDHEILLQKALAQYTTPSALRLMLLSAYSEYDVTEAMLIGLQDLRQVESKEAQVSYLDWCWSASEGLSEQGTDDRLASRVSELDLHTWSFLTRGYLAVLLNRRFPKIDPPAGIRRFDRFAVWMVRIFNSIRLEHMSCGLYIPLLLGIALSYLWLLNHTLGKLPKRFAFLDFVLLGVWVLVTMGTMHTHFSGGETLRSRFQMAVSLFAAILSFIVLTVVLRLLTR